MLADHLGDITTPGVKNPLHIPPVTLAELETLCPFTDEERSVLRYRARGFSILEISFLMQDDFGKRYPGGQYSDRKVARRIRSIKDKIAKAME